MQKRPRLVGEYVNLFARLHRRANHAQRRAIPSRRQRPGIAMRQDSLPIRNQPGAMPADVRAVVLHIGPDRRVRLRPGGQLRAGAAQNPLADLFDQAAILDHRDEQSRRHDFTAGAVSTNPATTRGRCHAKMAAATVFKMSAVASSSICGMPPSFLSLFCAALSESSSLSASFATVASSGTVVSRPLATSHISSFNSGRDSNSPESLPHSSATTRATSCGTWRGSGPREWPTR